MKFGKTLKSGDGTLTMRYGELKKQLKLMTGHMQSDDAAGVTRQCFAAELRAQI